MRNGSRLFISYTRKDGCALAVQLRNWHPALDPHHARGRAAHGHRVFTYEAGVAVTLNLPRLVLVEEGLLPRVVFDMQVKDFIVSFPQGSVAGWLESQEFQHAWDGWKQ